MIKIGDTVCAGDRNDTIARGVVVAIIPAMGNRVAMYRIRLEQEITAPTLTPNPNERWFDEGMIYGPFIDQPTGWDN